MVNAPEAIDYLILIGGAFFGVLGVVGVLGYNRGWFKVNSVRTFSQVFLVVMLNFTTLGNIYITPFLPILRIDIPKLIERGSIRACPLATIQRSLTMTWEMVLLFAVVSILVLVCLVFGRALCAWACPFGLIQDLLNRLRTFMGLNPFELSRPRHKFLTSFRFAVLFFLLLLSLSIGVAVLLNPASGAMLQSYLPAGISQTAPFCAICPTPTTYYIISIFTMGGDFQFSDPVHYAMIPIFLLIVLGAFAIPRFYCRYVCPVGAISSLFNKFSLLHVYKENWKCTKCNACYSNCPMRVEIVQDEDIKTNVNDIDCIICGECIERCPERCLHVRMGPLTLYSGGKSWSQKVDESAGLKKTSLKKKK